MNKLYIAFFILFFMSRPVHSSTIETSSTIRAVLNSSACYATIYSSNEIVLPSHCVEGPHEEVLLQGLGVKQIISVRNLSDIPLKDNAEKMLIITLFGGLFEGHENLHLESPTYGAINTATGIEAADCSIISIQDQKGFFTYRCPSNHGSSGLLLYQNGKPVGFHLGRIKSDGLAIAAMKYGPNIDLKQTYGQDFEPEKLRVSCCKKLQKAVQKIGDSINNGIDSVAKAIEDTKKEIKRVEDDITELPKVFSSEYIKQKTSFIKAPKFSEFKVDDVKWPEFQGDLDPTINSPAWFKKVVKGGGNFLTDAGNLVRTLVIDIPVMFFKEIANSKGLDLCGGCVTPPPPDICAESATDAEKKTCLSRLEEQIASLNGAKQQSATRLEKWIEAQKNKIEANQ